MKTAILLKYIDSLKSRFVGPKGASRFVHGRKILNPKAIRRRTYFEDYLDCRESRR